MSTTPEQMSLGLPKKPGFHFAKIENSDRLKRVFDLLTDSEWHSSRDIVERANIVAVSAAISEIRFNGFKVECEQRDRVFYYRMIRP